VFGLAGYPHILNPSPGEIQSVVMLWAFPRILMGLLAVMDTFLIYKISSGYYNRNVALVASILFAVMPINLLIRRVLLEPIQLPFLLSAILFAVYFRNSKPIMRGCTGSGEKESRKKIKNIMLISFSGIFLGLAIFTKIPALTLIPLVGFLIYTNSNRNERGIKALVLWLIPVILIPVIWPIYNLFTGHFNQWWAGVIQQTHRGVNTFISGFVYDFKIDSVFVIMAIAGLIFAAIKRDFFLLLWYVPFLIFLYILGFVSYWHFIPLLPPSCIAAARLIESLSNKIRNNNNKSRVRQILSSYVIISGIASFGLVTSGMLIAGSNNSSFLGAAAFATQYLHNNNGNGAIAVMSNPFYLWIPEYVFHLNAWYSSYYDRLPSTDGNILLIVDASFKDVLKLHETTEQVEKNFDLYTSNDRVAMFQGADPRRDQVTIYHYLQTFYFHISNVTLGKNVTFAITNLATGHSQVHMNRIDPALGNTVRVNSLGGFPSGAVLRGCIIDYLTGGINCDIKTVVSGRTDFYVSDS
jgi:hypothetical protein